MANINTLNTSLREPCLNGQPESGLRTLQGTQLLLRLAGLGSSRGLWVSLLIFNIYFYVFIPRGGCRLFESVFTAQLCCAITTGRESRSDGVHLLPLTSPAVVWELMVILQEPPPWQYTMDVISCLWIRASISSREGTNSLHLVFLRDS